MILPMLAFTNLATSMLFFYPAGSTLDIIVLIYSETTAGR